MKHMFITVGTTKFPKLIETITNLDILKTLKDLGYSEVQIQTGQGFDGVHIDPSIENVVVHKESRSWVVELPEFHITLKYDQYFENFEEQIKKADLVISHAGAGSCLDVLRLNKPLIVFVNEDLMDNHQTELACQLEKNGHLYSCNSKTLVNTLRKDVGALIPYPKPIDNLFSNYLDKCCGFIQ